MDRLRGLAADGPRVMPAIAVIAVLAALPGMFVFEATLDEAYVYAITRHGLAGTFDAWAMDPQALLPQLVALPFGVLGGGELWVLRIPSLVAFAAASALVWWAARPRFTPVVSAIAALLTAISPVATNVASDARWPALAMLAVVVGWGAILRALDATGGPGARRWWVLYTVAVVAGVYCNALTLLMVPAHLVAVLLAPRRAYRPWVGSLAAAAAGTVPLALAIRAADAVNPLVRLSDPGVTDVPGFAADLVAGSTPEILRQAAVLALTAVVVAAAWRERRRFGRPDVRNGLIAFAWAAVPTVLLFALSQGPDSLWERRYAFVSVPGIALLVAWSASRFPARTGSAVLGGVVLLYAAMSVITLDDPNNEHAERWSAQLAELRAPGTPVVFYEAEGVQAAGFYQRQFRTAEGDVILPGWDRTPPPPDIVLLDNPAFDRLPPGPPGVGLVERLSRGNGRVLLAVRPPDGAEAVVSWARANCEVRTFTYRYMAIYAITGCPAGGSPPS